MVIEELNQRVAEKHLLVNTIRNEISKILVGQRKLIESLLIGLFSNGHVLIEGVPGLAKTSAVMALAATVQADFKRIQFQRLQAMIGYCESVNCRRHVLLNYFGESYGTKCGNCDNCLEKVETWDGTIAAQKAMSNIYRTGERFGVEYLTDVLLGKEGRRITSFRHDRISTFGIGQELNRQDWKSVFRQIIAAGYVEVDLKGYGGLFLTSKGRAVLKSKDKIFLRKDLYKTEKLYKKDRANKTADRPDLEYSDSLFENLRRLRLDISKKENVPPYVIFHDRTLKEIAAYKPDSLEKMGRLYGVGKIKLKKFGQIFIDFIKTNGVI